MATRCCAALCGGLPRVRVPATDAALGLQRAAIAKTICVIDVDENDDREKDLEALLAKSRTPTVLVGRESLRLPAVWASQADGRAARP